MSGSAARHQGRAFSPWASGDAGIDRPVPVRKVPCPSCKARVNEPCVNGRGEPSGQHRSRRVMALRALREEEGDYDVADVSYAQRVSVTRRMVARQAARLTLPQLAQQLGCTASQIGSMEKAETRPLGALGARYGAWLRSVLDG